MSDASKLGPSSASPLVGIVPTFEVSTDAAVLAAGEGASCVVVELEPKPFHAGAAELGANGLVDVNCGAVAPVALNTTGAPGP